MAEIQCISDEKAALGESPVWSAADAAVYWVDILGRKLHRTDPARRETESWEMPSCPGMIALRHRGGIVVALEDGLYAFSPETSGLDRLVGIEADVADNRANDGKCDAAGRLWLGTMNAIDGDRPTGAFYRIDPDLTVTQIGSGFRIPNGLAWSPDDGMQYHTDTRTDVVHAFDFERKTGERSGQRDFFRFERARTGGVDGAAMDAGGGYWAALFGGGRLIRVTSEGDQDTEIPLPVSQPTMPAFGGADMKTLYVTSARKRLDAAALEAQPLAGGLFAVSVGVKGCPVHRFGG